MVLCYGSPSKLIYKLMLGLSFWCLPLVQTFSNHAEVESADLMLIKVVSSSAWGSVFSSSHFISLVKSDYLGGGGAPQNSSETQGEELKF